MSSLCLCYVVEGFSCCCFFFVVLFFCFNFLCYEGMGYVSIVKDSDHLTVFLALFSQGVLRQ